MRHVWICCLPFRIELSILSHPFVDLGLSDVRRCFAFFIFTATTGQIWRDKVSRKNAEGNVLYHQKNYPGALDKYVEVNDGKAHRQQLAYNLANTFYQQKKYQEALQELEKAIASDNSSSQREDLLQSGQHLLPVGKYQEAIESYKKTLELDPRTRKPNTTWNSRSRSCRRIRRSSRKIRRKKTSSQNRISKTRSRMVFGSAEATAAFTAKRPQNQPQNANSSRNRTRNGRRPGQQQKGGHGPERGIAYSGRA